MHRSKGFSLVELMVAITLALVITAAVISVFVGSRTAYQSTSGEAAVTDGGRTALDLIGQDLRNAGYIACSETIWPYWSGNPSDSRISVDQLNNAQGTLAYDFRFGLGGYEANGTAPGDALALPATPVVDTTAADWVPALDPTFTTGGANAPTQVNGSDVLVIRSSLQATPAYTSARIMPQAAPNTITVNAVAGLQSGQIAAISDCTKAVVFQISAPPAGPPGGVVVTLGPTGADLPGNVVSANIPLPFEVGAVVMPLTTTVYYIGKGADGDSALKRLSLNAPNAPVPGQLTDQEVVPDVENMQVLYGVANAGTWVPAQYVTADQVADFRSVVSVKVALLVASPPGAGTGPPVAQGPFTLLNTTVTAAADNRQRRVFEFTVGIRNQMP